ncbi:hypothetical protein Hdeb2414_s1029g00974531 [Helianthus debilis subsp. tardiflorus]
MSRVYTLLLLLNSRVNRSCRDEMSSRDKDATAPHQPLLSSLVVRPTDSGGGGGGGSDYEPGEVRRDPPPYSRSDRFDDDNNSHAEKKMAGARTLRS